MFAEVLVDVGDGLTEDAVDRRPGAGHGGIDGTHVVELVLDGCDFGIGAEDTWLEIIRDAVAPLLDGAAYQRREGDVRSLWRHARVSFPCRHADGRFHQDDVHSFEAQVYGRELVAYARGQYGSVLDEEGAVSSQA